MAVAEGEVRVDDGGFGIDWPNPDQVSDGDKLNFMMALVIGLIGIGLGVLGYRITKRQGEIAEAQHRFFERERERKAVLKLVLPNPPMSSSPGPTRYQLYIQNEGDKAGTAFWYMGIPKRMRGRVTVETSNGNEEVVFPGDNWDIFSDFDQPQVSHFTDDYYLLKFMMTQPVEPGVMMPCGAVLVEWTWGKSQWLGQEGVEVRTQAWRIFGWFTNGPSGRFPERGMRKLRMYQRTEPTFKNYHGGIELPADDPEEFH